MRLVEPAVFRSRLDALERWLWSEGLAACGLDAPPVSLLAARVEELSDLYTLERDRLQAATLRRGHVAPRVLYFLCSDAPKVHLVLRELVDRHGEGCLSGARTVDLGCGVGATAAGLLLSLDANASPPISLLGVDCDPAVLPIWTAVARQCAAIAGVVLEARTQVASLLDFEPDAAGSLIVCQAAMNECLDAPQSGDRGLALHRGAPIVDRVRRWASHRPCILIEPALRVATRPLHALRDAVVACHDGGAGVQVLAPCPHQAACPMLANPRDWCHEVRVWPPSPRVAEVQAITRRRENRVKFSFVVLAPAERASARTDAGDCPAIHARLVSDPLASKGKVERLICTGQGSLRRLRVLDRERTPDNQLLATAARGTMIEIGGLGQGDRVAGGVSVTDRSARPSRNPAPPREAT